MTDKLSDKLKNYNNYNDHIHSHPKLQKLLQHIHVEFHVHELMMAQLQGGLVYSRRREEVLRDELLLTTFKQFYDFTEQMYSHTFT